MGSRYREGDGSNVEAYRKTIPRLAVSADAAEFENLVTNNSQNVENNDGWVTLRQDRVFAGIAEAEVASDAPEDAHYGQNYLSRKYDHDNHKINMVEKPAGETRSLVCAEIDWIIIIIQFKFYDHFNICHSNN